MQKSFKRTIRLLLAVAPVTVIAINIPNYDEGLGYKPVSLGFNRTLWQ